MAGNYTESYNLLVTLIESDANIKEYICSEAFKQKLCCRNKKPTKISITSVEYVQFTKFVDARGRNLNGASAPSLEQFFRYITQYLVRVNLEFLNWAKKSG